MFIAIVETFLTLWVYFYRFTIIRQYFNCHKLLNKPFVCNT